MPVKLSVLCLLLLLPLPAPAQEKTCQQAKISGSNRWFPVAFVDDDGHRAQGIGYDLLKHIGQKLGLELELELSVRLPWKRVLKYLETGELDMISALYWNAPRAELYDYSRPYFYNKSHLFVLSDKMFSYQEPGDLSPFSGMYLSGSSFGEDFDRIIRENKLQLQEVTDRKMMIRALFSGLADYFIHDRADMFRYLKQRQLHTTIVPLPTLVAAIAVHFGLSKKSPCIALLPEINREIERAQADGTLDRLMEKYRQGDEKKPLPLR